jgi:hypothetical protein
MSYIGNQPISAAFLTDTFSGTGSQTAYTMTVAPANTSSIIVAITGVLQDPSTYSVSGTTLTFSAAPPSGTSNISVRYLGIPASGVTTTAYRTVTNFTATAGQTSFSVPSYTVGYIDVYRNGVRLVSTDYTATTGTTVVLNNACTSGDSVVTESFLVSSVLNAIPATAGSISLTSATYLSGILPVAYGGTGLSAGGPAFSAYGNVSYSITSGVDTKVRFQTERFDTANCFDNVTNYRFTPNVAGYYQINYIGRFQASSPSIAYLMLYKNGSSYITGNQIMGISGGSNFDMPASELVYMNGTTDYLEVYINVGGSSILVNENTTTTFVSSFSGYLARNA